MEGGVVLVFDRQYGWVWRAFPKDIPLAGAMSMAGERLVAELLKKHLLVSCPDCRSDLTAENIGRNEAPNIDDDVPVVHIACKGCRKRLVVIQVQEFPFHSWTRSRR